MSVLRDEVSFRGTGTNGRFQNALVINWLARVVVGFF